MATVRKTITHIDNGHYANDSEYIRYLIRREQGVV